MTRTLMITAAIGLLAGSASTALAAVASHQTAKSPHAPYHDVVVHEHLSTATHEVRSKHVRYQDLDVNSTQGAETLVRRIKGASEKVCGGPHKGKRSLAETTAHKKCVTDAMDEAVQSLNAPSVTDAYKRIYG